jgi:uncharacterized protein (TIGR00255 family)
MTGYAYKEKDDSAARYSVEIKSYNARFLDMYIGLPPFLGRLEGRFRKLADSRARRGKIEVYIKIKRLSQAGTLSVDFELAALLEKSLGDLAARLGIDGAVPLSLLASLPGVICAEDERDIESYWEAVAPLFEDALEEFDAERLREGEALKKDIVSHITALEGAFRIFESYQEQMENSIRESIQRKFREVLGNAVDEQRVLTETAALLVKNTVTEEIARLASHLESLRKELESEETPGRKIDFICQEINREINTIGAKNQSIEAGRAVVDAKDALESIREQARNIE